MSQTPIEASSLYNEDLAPVPPAKRSWGTGNYAALWISMSLCIPTYQLASGMIQKGMSWWQAILIMFLGNAIVLVPMLLNGHAGAKYGLSFPVFARASFGTRGANVPAMLRAIVACGWFGIQTWIGGESVYQLLRTWNPGLAAVKVEGLFPQPLPLACFALFWLLNMWVIHKGVESIRRLLVFKAIFLPLAAVALFAWAAVAIDGLAPVLAAPTTEAQWTVFRSSFFPTLTSVVGFWATVSLNIPDFTRYARSQRSQVRGQAIGLPPSMTLFAFVAVFVTAASAILYGKAEWDPVALASHFDSKVVVSLAMVGIIISTLATNIAANMVSPANDFANLAPKKISFRTGGFITGIIGLCIFPWKLVADPNGYIFTWLIGYSGLLGPVGGIMIADYYFICKQRLKVQELYAHDGRYGYAGGYNQKAMLALVLGILPNIPGFLVTVKLLPAARITPWIADLYNYAWFVGFLLSGALYIFLMRRRAQPDSDEAPIPEEQPAYAPAH